MQRIDLATVTVRTHNKGYMRAYVPGYPSASKDGHILLHRLIMEQYLGRYLLSSEVVHHLNGDKTNNNVDNLELKTQHKHAQQHAVERAAESGLGTEKEFVCCVCGESFSGYGERKTCSKRCQTLKQYRDNWPSDEDLARLVWEKPSRAIAAQLGVSDSMLSRRCKQRGIRKPPRGWWAKQSRDGREAEAAGCNPV